MSPVCVCKRETLSVNNKHFTTYTATSLNMILRCSLTYEVGKIRAMQNFQRAVEKAFFNLWILKGDRNITFIFRSLYLVFRFSNWASLQCCRGNHAPTCIKLLFQNVCKKSVRTISNLRNQFKTTKHNVSDSEMHSMDADSLLLATDLPNTSEGLSNSRSFPPLLVSYVANPPSGFPMLRSYKERTDTWHVQELE